VFAITKTEPLKNHRQASADGEERVVGLVSPLDHPGNNITGVTSISLDIGSKPLGLLRDLLPRAHRVAMTAALADNGRSCGRSAGVAATYAHTGTAVAFIISELPGGRAEALFIAMAALVPTAGEPHQPRVVRIQRLRHVG
jgi:hypothetical protein